MDSILANIMAFTDKGNNNVSFLPVTTTERKQMLTTDSSDIVLSIICFSKERPFQLHQLLLSITNSFDSVPDKILVLYAPGQFESLYAEVFHMHPHVIAVKESDFYNDLMFCVNSVVDLSYVVFCVDDLIFTNKFSTREHLSCLRDDLSIFSLQLKLHPGIVYSHSGTRASPPPRLTGARTNGNHPVVYLTYSLRSGSSPEWRYPFDLCASVYRLEDVKQIVSIALSFGPDALSNPNKLEVNGNKAFWGGGLSTKYSRCACPALYLVCVVTVNRVQSTYDVPIYQNTGGDLHTLNNLLRLSVVDGDSRLDVGFDFQRYESLSNLSVHIGEVYFASIASNRLAVPRSLSGAPQVSVLLPVFNEERHLRQCLHSLFHQSQGCRFEVLVVDDGSSDISLAIAEEFRGVADDRGIPLVVVGLSHQGLVAALNEGLRRASSGLIARMDADDVCEPNRLARQMSFLSAHPEIHVLGTQALTFSGAAPCSVDDLSSSHLAANMPTHPTLVAWEMLFRCAVLHPSVMFRREVVTQCGGYGEENEGREGAMRDVDCIEDYALWGRVLDRHPLGVASLPDVLLHLRLRADSKSQVEAVRARNAARDLQFERLVALVTAAGGDETIARDTFDALMDTERHLLDPERAAEVLDFLEAIFGAFLRSVARCTSELRSSVEMRSLALQHKETKILSYMAAESSSDESDMEGSVPVDVQRMLRHSVDRLKRKFLVAAHKQFPTHIGLNELIALQGGENSFEDVEGRSAMMLKDLIVGSSR